MAVEIYANRPATTVTSGGTTAPAPLTVETWTVASSTSFPAASSSAVPPTQFHVADPAMPTEMILVTNVSGSTWTVTRGIEGTPVAHTAGFTVNQVASAGVFTQLRAVAWVNVATQYSADPTGVVDATSAFQSALNFLATAGGGVLYIPTGEYLITATLTWTSSDSLMIVGDGADATIINRASSVAPFHSLDIRNVTGSVTVANLQVLNTVNAGSFADDQVGLYFSACNRVRLENVHINSSVNRVNIAVEFNNCTTCSVVTCDLRGYVNALLINGGTAVVDCVATSFSTNNGSGQTNAANVAMISSAATVHLTNCIANGGDHGLVLQGGSPDSFLFVHDFEVNNCHGHAVVLATGAQAWLEQLWCSNQSIANNEAAYDGVHIASTYGGWAVIADSTIQHYSGNGISIGGGQSYWILDTSFSGCCGNASNTYDNLFVAASVSDVTIRGNHFDLEPFNTPNTPRSGVFITSGASNYQVYGNAFNASAYGTSSCVDGNAAATIAQAWRNNLNGFGGALSAAASFTTWANNPVGATETIMVQIPVNPYDLQVGAVWEFELWGTYTNSTGSTSNTLRVRAGTAGTTADTSLGTIVTTSNSSSSGVAVNTTIKGTVTLTGAGSSGTAELSAVILSLGTSPEYAGSSVAGSSTALSSWNTGTSIWLSITMTVATGASPNHWVPLQATLKKVV